MKMPLRWMPVAFFALACSSCVIPIQPPRDSGARETRPEPVPAVVYAPAQAPATANQVNMSHAAASSSQGEIAVISVTSVAGLSGKHLNQFREIDGKIMDLVKQDLLNRGMSVAAMQTTRQPYMLAISVNKVDCGQDQNCQANATIGASYVLKRYNSVLRSGKIEEQSKPGWQKSARKIAEVIGGETAAGIVAGPAGYRAASPAALPVAPRDEARIAVLSESKMTGRSGKLQNHFRDVDISLMTGIGKDLQDNGVGVADSKSGASRYVLSFKIDKLDCGPKDKCQVNATIGTSYVLKKDGAVLKSSRAEEHSNGGLQKAVSKITERIAGDVAGAMGRR
jgi:hypothetical protein